MTTWVLPLFVFFLCLVPKSASANAYFGLNGSYSFFSSPEFRDLKVSSKGPGYGALIGVGKDFVGLEAFYQTLNSEGDIKHEGEKAKINMNAAAFGAALRFSFQSFFLRLGVAQYSLDQSVDIDNATNRRAAEDVYKIQNDSAMGVLFGIGVHGKFRIGRLYLDYTRHQISSVGNYDAISFGAVWLIPDRLFSISSGN